MSSKLSGRRLSNKNLMDIRRDNNFIVSIENVTGDGNSLQLVITKAFLPKVSLDVLNIRHGNDAIKLAGVASWEGGTISFHDVLEESAFNTVMDWFKEIYDPETGKIGKASVYKKSGTIKEAAPDGTYVRTWDVHGMWISALDFGALDAAGGNTREISMTIQIDPPTTFGPTVDKTETL